MNSDDFNSPWHDTEVMELEDAVRRHPARGFKVPRWTHRCPGCGRGVLASMLEAPHWNPVGDPICSTCRKHNAKWFRTPQQIEATRKAKEKRRALGIAPRPGGFPVE